MSDRVVRHETPDYNYNPQGLMADGWGSAGYRTQVTEFLEKDHLQQRRWMDNDEGRDALEYIWRLDDQTVLAARVYGSEEHSEVVRRLGDVNPWWVTERCATTAYARGLIDEQGLDRIVRDI